MSEKYSNSSTQMEKGLTPQLVQVSGAKATHQPLEIPQQFAQEFGVEPDDWFAGPEFLSQLNIQDPAIEFNQITTGLVLRRFPQIVEPENTYLVREQGTETPCFKTGSEVQPDDALIFLVVLSYRQLRQ